MTALYRAYVFFSIADVKTLRHIGWNRDEFDFVQAIFLWFSISVVAKKAISSASSRLGLFFLSATIAKLKHCSFAFLHGWADASTLPKELFTHLKAPSIFPTEALHELSCFAQSFFFCEEAICGERERTFWNPIVNADVVTADKRNIDEGIAWYTSKTRLLQDHLKENCACVWVAKRRELVNVWIAWIAALLNLDVAFDDKL